jgi:hypothetical protein
MLPRPWQRPQALSIVFRVRPVRRLSGSIRLRLYAPGCSLRTFLFPAYRGSITRVIPRPAGSQHNACVAPCCMCMLHVHVACCPRWCMLHVHVACCMLHAHVACCMLHAHVACCPCWCMRVPTFHILVHRMVHACFPPWCMCMFPAHLFHVLFSLRMRYVLNLVYMCTCA